MLKCLLFNLPTMPKFGAYNTNSLKAKTERATAMYNDAHACVNMFASNSKNYAISARSYVDELVDGKITVMPNAFGSFGEGLLNVSKVKTGEVTIVRLAQVGGELVIHASLGTAVTPETWEEAGWAPPAPQLPSIEVKFDYCADEFLKNVMAQHYIVTYGNNMELLENYCAINGLKLIK